MLILFFLCSTLNVAEAYTRPGRLFLNRPLISALDPRRSQQRVPQPPPHRRRSSREQQARLRRRAPAPRAVRPRTQPLAPALDHVFRRLWQSSGFASRGRALPSSPDECGRVCECAFRAACPQSVTDLPPRPVLKRFKTSMRLPLPGCYTLVGVPDQDKWLVENEIYACVAEVGKEPIWITGRVAITRSPTLDAGDV